jgi:hypothetical protein
MWFDQRYGSHVSFECGPTLRFESNAGDRARLACAAPSPRRRTSFGCELRGKPPRASPKAKKGIRSNDPAVHYAKWGLVEGPMRHPLDRADHYRNEAIKCHELAKHAQHAYLGDFYRHIAVRYMFMAEELLNEARARGEVGPQSDRGGASRNSTSSNVASLVGSAAPLRPAER